MFDKYMFALGRGVRSAINALDEPKTESADPAHARDVTPRAPALDAPALPGIALKWTGAVQIMGVVNVTPDSFSDGGLYLDQERAIAHGDWPFRCIYCQATFQTADRWFPYCSPECAIDAEGESE